MHRNYLVILFLLLLTLSVRADDGMWIPMLLNKYSMSEMQNDGFRLNRR